MKKLMLCLFLCLNFFSFSDVNDNLKLLQSEEIKLIEQKIKELENEKSLKIYVNTLPIDEGFAVAEPEKTIILNLKKAENGRKFQTELSFSKDIDIEDIKSDLNDILIETENLLKNSQYSKYLLDTLDGVSTLLKDVNIKQLNSMTMTKEQEENGNNFYLIAMIIVAIIISAGIVFNKIKNLDEKEEN